MRNSYRQHKPSNQTGYTPVNMGYFPSQGGFSHNNLSINSSGMNQSVRPVNYQAHTHNPKPEQVNNQSYHIAHRTNESYLVDHTSPFHKQSFYEPNNHSRRQNPTMRQDYQSHPQQSHSFNTDYQQRRQRVNNERMNANQYESDFQGRQLNFNLTDHFQQSNRENNHSNQAINNHRFDSYQVALDRQQRQRRQNEIRQREYQNHGYYHHPQQFFYQTHNIPQHWPNGFTNYQHNVFQRSQQVMNNYSTPQYVNIQQQNFTSNKLKYPNNNYRNENKTKPHSNIKNMNLIMASNDLTQKGLPQIVHFDATQATKPKTDVELLLSQIQQLNRVLQSHIKEIQISICKNSQHRPKVQDNQELKRRVKMIRGVIEGNYKICQQKEYQLRNNCARGYKPQYDKSKQRQWIDFNTYELVDIKQEFNKLVQISNSYLHEGPQRYFRDDVKDKTQQFNRQNIQTHQYYNQPTQIFNHQHINEYVNQNRQEYVNQNRQEYVNQNRQEYVNQNRQENRKGHDHPNLDHQYDNQNRTNESEQERQHMSSSQCRSVFIELICEITKFYHLNYLIYKSCGPQSYSSDRQIWSSQCKQSAPLLINNILWHIQSIRLIIQAYQHQFIITNLSRETHYKLSSKVLQTLKSKWIQLWNELQDLMVDFLQEIMISPQSLNTQSSEYPRAHQQIHIQRTIWFFYYEYPTFNLKWIYNLLETFLQTQMLTAIHLQILNKQTSINNQLTNSRHHKANIINEELNVQVQNNLLSILSFLLHPHTYNKQNSQLNPINELLDAPIKQLIVRHIKSHQKQSSRLSADNDKIDWRIKYLLTKYLTLQKVTSIISFYTSKLASSTYAQQSHLKHKGANSPSHKLGANKKSNTNKPIETSRINTDKQSLYTKQQLSKQDNQRGKVFSIELKVMQLTLFVRQIADVLIIDRVEYIGLEQKQQANQDMARDYCLVDQIKKKLTVQSVLSRLFQKILSRKKLQKL